MPGIDWYERLEAIKRLLNHALGEATDEGDEVKALAFLVLAKDKLEKLIKEVVE